MAEPRLATGTVVHQRYRIVRPVGRGGMGAVYEAIDERLGHAVALKQTLVDGEVAERAFEREARLLASLRHPALPAVSDFFGDADGRYLVMQFIPGRTLAELAQERGAPFPVDQVLHWADALLRALEYLHGRTPPILHRDIKPANLKMTAEGEVVLLDFGLAKGSGETTSTGPSVYGLTPTYAPLEQFQGSGTEPSSDLFSLAATLYFLLTQAAPPDALTRASQLAMGKPDPLAPATTVNPEVPLRVTALLQKAMAVHKEDRYRSAAEMRRALNEVRTGVTEQPAPTVPMWAAAPGATTATVPGRARRGGGVRGLWLVGGAVVLLGVLAAALVLRALWSRQQAEAARAALVPRIEFAEGEGYEIRWRGKDYWAVKAGDRALETHAGNGSGKADPGRYTVAPVSNGVFEPVAFEVRSGKKTIVSIPSGRLEFRWRGGDYWRVMRGDTSVFLANGSAACQLQPGPYQIVPHSDAVFEPMDVAIEPDRDTVVTPPAGRVEFRWPRREDYWWFRRGDTNVGLHTGTATRILSPGRYQVVGHSEAPFEPIAFTVEDGKDVVIDPPVGSVEFRWPAQDYWSIKRDGEQVALLSGTARRVLSAGRYRIVPHSDAVFEDVEFAVAPGDELLLSPPAGRVEVKASGDDYWALLRKGERVALLQAGKARAVSAGPYRLVPHSGASDVEPVDFEVIAGQTVVVRAK